MGNKKYYIITAVCQSLCVTITRWGFCWIK